MIDYKQVIRRIRIELKNYIIENKLKSLVLGISGGADSTLIALLASPVCDDLEIPLLGTSITIESNKLDEQNRARLVGNMSCDSFSEIDLTSLYNNFDSFNPAIGDVLTGKPKKDIKIRQGNIKARIRMIYLYNLASMTKGMVLSTDNYTEYLLGFWTQHGDVGDFGMIQNLWKTEVYEMLEYFANTASDDQTKSIIEEVINADATDGLGITNTDLDQILPGWEGSSKDGYTEVDKLLKSGLKDVHRIKTSTDLVYTSNDVLDRMLSTEFKRNTPVNIPREKLI
jgi:NAD+ synthetase